MRQKKAFQSRNATERYSGAMFFIKFKRQDFLTSKVLKTAWVFISKLSFFPTVQQQTFHQKSSIHVSVDVGCWVAKPLS